MIAPERSELHDRISVQFHVMRRRATSPGKALDEVRIGRFVRVEELPGSRAAASSAVSRTHRHGDLVAIRQGLYFKGAKTRYGMTYPSSEQIAVEGNVGVGPTGYTAARTLGLTTQVPTQPTLTVAGPVPTSIPGVKICKCNNLRRRTLRYTEIALLELLRGEWESTVDGGWSALASAFDVAVRAHQIRPTVLAEAVRSERSPAARENFTRLTGDRHAQHPVVSA